jgi:hypothetical protein
MFSKERKNTNQHFVKFFVLFFAAVACRQQNKQHCGGAVQEREACSNRVCTLAENNFSNKMPVSKVYQ